MTGSERSLTSLDPGLRCSVAGGNTMADGVDIGVGVGAVAQVETDEEQQK